MVTVSNGPGAIAPVKPRTKPTAKRLHTFIGD
jgi:hypothetical protein